MSRASSDSRHPSANAPLESLEGLIERVTFHQPDTGFSVLRVQAKGHRALVTVVGRLPAVTAGEWLNAAGRWVESRDHGRQFQADSLRTSPPTSKEGITRYLGSGLIHGVGPQLAAKLVQHFGEAILEIIDHSSARLEEVDGIGPGRRRRIKQAWEEQRQVRAIMLFLHSHGISSSRAFRIYKAYGEESIQKVRADPYLLARDIQGIGFKSADQIACRMGLAPDAPARIAAGLRHLLMEATQSGHCALPDTLLVTQATELLGLEEAAVRTELQQTLARGDLVLEKVQDETWVYVPFLKQAEEEIARRLLRLAAEPVQYPSMDVVRARHWVESRFQQDLSESQGRALEAALTHRVLIVTGGPGVGKTTLLRAILAVLSAKKVSCTLAAPTGRAAQRLSEATGMPACTLHRLLEARGGTQGFGRTPEHPLEGQLFVIDEMSMVDVPLFRALLRALPPEASLLLVGDPDQLPSVGPGAVLAHCLASSRIPSVRLTEVFRQASQSDIVRNAHRILQGHLPQGGKADAGSDFFILGREEPEAIVTTLVDLVARRLPARYHWDPIEEIQVLAPTHRGPLGVRALNEHLQNALNPSRGPADELVAFGTVFRVGDKVMQMENDYDREVFNGDIGRVESVDAEEGSVVLRFDHRRLTYAVHEMDALSLAYAVTIHKSQGSEFPAVVIPLATSHYMLLQRNLLYTAVTRGRRMVVLVGQSRAVAMAVHRVETSLRYTALDLRLG